MRRSLARAGLLKGDSADGDWMTPAMVAASASETLLTSFAEEQARRLGDAEDGKRPALAEGDFVEVHLEDVVLRRPAGEHDGQKLLEQLASDGPHAGALQRHPFELRQEHVANDLLGDGAGAGEHGPPSGRVGEERPGDCQIGSTPGCW